MNKKTFSDEFINSAWNKKPFSLDIEKDIEIPDEKDIFQALLKYKTDLPELQKINPLADFVTAINNNRTTKIRDDFCLEAGDLTLDNYLNRIDLINNANEWSIAYFGLHGSSHIIWDFAKKFIDTLSKSIGYRPGGRADVDCFIGKYSSTPSGIHADDAHNFGFSIRNGKTMLTWDSSRSDLAKLKYPHYEHARNDAIPLLNTTDKICYFPFDAFHIAETPKEISLNINISLWHCSDDAKDSIDYINTFLKHDESLINDISCNGEITLNDEDILNLVSLKNKIMDGSIERHMAMKKLLINTTSGMKVKRPKDNYEFDINKPILIKDTASIQWYVNNDRDLIILAVNGYFLFIEYSKKNIELLVFLASNSGKIFNYYDISKLFNIDSLNIFKELKNFGLLGNI